MERQLKDILQIEDVSAVLVLTAEGAIRRRITNTDAFGKTSMPDWRSMVLALAAAPSAEIVFERQRIYFHRLKESYLVVITGRIAPMAIVRLRCNALAGALDVDAAAAKGPA